MLYNVQLDNSWPFATQPEQRAHYAHLIHEDRTADGGPEKMRLLAVTMSSLYDTCLSMPATGTPDSHTGFCKPHLCGTYPTQLPNQTSPQHRLAHAAPTHCWRATRLPAPMITRQNCLETRVPPIDHQSIRPLVALKQALPLLSLCPGLLHARWALLQRSHRPRSVHFHSGPDCARRAASAVHSKCQAQLQRVDAAQNTMQCSSR